MWFRRVVTANRGDDGRRLDLVLQQHLADLHGASRTRIQNWIRSGRVSVNGAERRRVATRVALGDVVTVALPEALVATDSRSPGAIPEHLPLDVIYEDDYLLAVNKPAGMVVHPAYKNTTGTLLNGLLWRARHWPPPQRPSIVGRLDKLTSGIVVAAKTAAAHAALQRSMASDARKEYLAVVYGRPTEKGAIRLPLTRSDRDRRNVIVSASADRHALTRFERLACLAAPSAGLSLVRCELVTGRMHQIRVHLAARGWPVVGDPVYGEPRWRKIRDPALAVMVAAFPRQALHAWRLVLLHPFSRAQLLLEAPLPRDLTELLIATGLDRSRVAEEQSRA